MGLRRLGKYVLQRRIAVGGMGEIFYGKIGGIAGFEREVAIKKMLPHLTADKNFIDMIIKEAKLTVLLNHPNIVQVYDLAKEGEEYYIAMEYVPGINVGTLLETCRKHGLLLPVEVAAHITLNLLKGLAYAHSLGDNTGQPMGVLHRDVTPQNILVTAQGWVKITDFGIAKARNEISTTSPGMIKGKLGYIAPEQLTAAEADQRIDLFCAGIVLWESLACRRLFKGSSEIDTFRLIAEAKVPSLKDVRDDVSPELEAVIRKALSRDPDARYPSGGAFYEALAQSLAPRSPDDCQAAAQAFFSAHPELFISVNVVEDVELDENEPTMQLDGGEGPSTAVDVAPLGSSMRDAASARDAITRPVPKTRRITWGAALAVVLLVGALSVAAWRFRDALSSGEAAVADALTADEIQLGVDAEEGELTACYCKAPADQAKLESLRALLVVASTGGVAKVELRPRIEPKIDRCLESVLDGLKFRGHQAPKVEAEVILPAPHECGRPSGGGTTAGGGAAKATKPLGRGEIQEVITRHSAVIARCLQKMDASQAPAEVRPQIRIDTSGKVSSVAIKPALSDGEAQSCLTRVLKGMKFRRHPDKDLAPITIPLTIKQG